MENNVKNTNNILGALCGLARACVSNPYTEKTDGTYDRGACRLRPWQKRS